MRQQGQYNTEHSQRQPATRRLISPSAPVTIASVQQPANRFSLLEPAARPGTAALAAQRNGAARRPLGQMDHQLLANSAGQPLQRVQRYGRVVGVQ